MKPVATAMQGSQLKAKFFPEIGAGGFSSVDGTIEFYQRVTALLRADAVVVDFGAGRGRAHYEDPVAYRRELNCLRGKVAKVIGVDVDPVVTTNPTVDQAIVLNPRDNIPLADGSVDLIVSDCTFEHIDDPQHVARELDRILAPGGWICARTPNRFGYIALANRIVPESMQERVLRVVQPSRQKKDVFPAVYRLNSKAALRQYFDPARYDHFVYAWDSEPAYHAGSPLLYRLFLFVHAISPSTFKAMLHIFLRKKA